MITRSNRMLYRATYCLAMLCFSAIANEPFSDIDGLISDNRWKEAARLIFIEARTTDKHESSIVIGQARANLVEDALNTIEATNSASRSWLLMSLVQEAPALPTQKREELLRYALDLARARTDEVSSNYLMSGDLARISLYYSGTGRDHEAKIIFSEAMAAADKGLSEKGTGGFRQITELLRRARSSEVNPWMLSLLQNRLTQTDDARNLAFACIDMVATAGRIDSRDLVAPFINCSTSAIAKIDNSSLKNLAIGALAEAKDEAGIPNLNPSNSPFVAAVREARSGNAQKSYAIVSGLGKNLYIDFKSAAYEQVFDDSIRRGDLETAQYFAERPPRQLPNKEIFVWQRLAEKMIKVGKQQAASDSYKKASVALDKIKYQKYIYLFDIQSAIRLGESMLQNGMIDEGRRILFLAQSFLKKIPEILVHDRVIASISLSESFRRIGIQSDAKMQIKEAYRYAHSYDTKRLFGNMEKARLLASIGLSISMYSNSKLHGKEVEKVRTETQ